VLEFVMVVLGGDFVLAHVGMHFPDAHASVARGACYAEFPLPVLPRVIVELPLIGAQKPYPEYKDSGVTPPPLSASASTWRRSAWPAQSHSQNAHLRTVASRLRWHGTCRTRIAPWPVWRRG
jgi:hypothetical protein